MSHPCLHPCSPRPAPTTLAVKSWWATFISTSLLGRDVLARTRVVQVIQMTSPSGTGMSNSHGTHVLRGHDGQPVGVGLSCPSSELNVSLGEDLLVGGKTRRKRILEILIFGRGPHPEDSFSLNSSWPPQLNPERGGFTGVAFTPGGQDLGEGCSLFAGLHPRFPEG